MSWNDEFYQKYAEHLEEPIVRQTHDRMFKHFSLINPKLKYTSINVVDFGCGTGEYHKYDMLHKEYFGIDKNKINDVLPHSQIDFMKEEFVLPFIPNAFISVFATELIVPPIDKYNFYRLMFQNYPIEVAMVAGFFYKGKETDSIVEESGGFTTYQTIENQVDWICPEFTEFRCCCPVPSAMWGDVVEVWKFLVRNGDK